MVILEEGKAPWYGPSFGPEPETVGSIQVRHLSGEKPGMETQIKVCNQDTEWQPPVKFELDADQDTKVDPSKLKWGTVVEEGSGKEESEKKRVCQGVGGANVDTLEGCDKPAEKKGGEKPTEEKKEDTPTEETKA